jgi:putative membrane protein
MGRSKRSKIHLLLIGLVMGIAELIPGISGGTVAFISGIYEEFLEGISSFHPGNFFLLFRGKFKEFDQAVKWRFIFCLLAGMFFSLLSLAHVIRFFLNDPFLRSYLYALFFGFILASAHLSYRRVRQWSLKCVVGLCCGILIAFVLTSDPQKLLGIPHVAFADHFLPNSFWIRGSLIAGGIAGITAMLLPGISGSYILNILGFYPLIITALSQPMEAESLSVLGNVGFGVIVGGLLFARLILWVVTNYHDVAVATLTGFIIGAIRTLWPFWTYEHTLSPGVHLKPISPYFPPLDDPTTWTVFATTAIACAIALTLERLILKKEKKTLRL